MQRQSVGRWLVRVVRVVRVARVVRVVRVVRVARVVRVVRASSGNGVAIRCPDEAGARVGVAM